MDIHQILSTLILIIFILIVYYISTSQRRKHDSELKQMQDSLKENDKIITFSGLAGIVEEVHEDRIIVSTYPDKVKISIEKWAVAGFDDRDIK